ncbi:hypothetical protein [Bordetella sp. N]|uniref:hypothetical protein n=1 Tax=Bordetella sp. N TaxID=1746199 RepID=UPI0007093A22|nr:hypothetical protein [Bordetella sp. N]ALM84372.1 hypothetical protein ASB57_16590 [Bordetella sp. N]
MGFDLGSLLSQYANAAKGGDPTAPAGDVGDHFDQAAQNAPTDLLSQGLAAMLRSDQTPPFAQAAAQMFGQADPNQQAGMLNHLLSGLGPQVLASLMSGAAGGGLASLLAQATQGGGTPTVTPEQASTVTPDQMAQIASHAEQQNPDIIEHMTAFYAQHATLIKTLGGAALTVALARMQASQRR